MTKEAALVNQEYVQRELRMCGSKRAAKKVSRLKIAIYNVRILLIDEHIQEFEDVREPMLVS